LPGGTIIEGKPLLFADDFDFINEDTIVFSDGIFFLFTVLGKLAVFSGVFSENSQFFGGFRVEIPKGPVPRK
jgi:hypothetical protein